MKYDGRWISEVGIKKYRQVVPARKPRFYNEVHHSH